MLRPKAVGWGAGVHFPRSVVPHLPHFPQLPICSPLTRPVRGNPFVGSPPKGKEVKFKEVILSLTRKRPSNPEPVAAIPTRGIVKVAIREASTLPNPYHASLPAPSSSCCRAKIELYPPDQSGGMRHSSWSNRATRDRFPRITVSFCGQADPG